MHFKSKTSLLLSSAALVFLSACGDDSSSKSVDPEDSAINPENTVPGDSTATDPVPSDTSATPSDSTATPEDSTANNGELPAEGPIDTPNGKGLLVDDFEDGDNHSKTIDSYWYTYDDNGNDGASVITTPVNEDGDIIATAVNNGSKYALQVNYTLDKGEYAYEPYVGWGIQIAEDDANGRFGGITYWYKGGAHIARVEISDVTDYDVHMTKVRASRTWTKVEIRFKDMAQEGWGVEVPFDARHIKAISFQAKGSATVSSDSLLIDNLYLQDTSEVAPDVADMTINDPLIPEVTIGEIAISNPLQEKAMKYLNKGINITNWLEEKGTVFNGKFKFDESDVKLMAENGIKALRLPIDLDQYATNRDKFIADTTNTLELEFDDENLFAVLDSFVEWTGKYNMSITIDYHEYDNGYNTKSSIDPRYTKMMANVWKHVAKHYADNDREDIFFELLNEPDMSDGKVTSANWRKAAQEDIDSIRTVDSKHTIIFGDAQWYSISLLAKGTPLNDDNVIYAIHTYEPFVFTHQSASWADTKTIKNLMFPYDKERWSEFSADFGVTKSTPTWIKTAVKNYYKNGNKEAILKLILPAKEWAVTNNVPVIINEFGAYNLKTDKQSVLNYMAAMTSISDTLQIPLTHWGYTGGFSLFESTDGVKGTTMIEGMKDAYGLE